VAKQLKYSEEARQKLKSGIDAVAKAVGTTLGPKGRNVALDKKWGAPSVVHDGVSIAKEIELEDPFANMGAQLVKQAAEKTNDVTGDGTTTATILVQAIVEEGLKNITAGANPMILVKGIEKAGQQAVVSLEKQAKPIKGQDIANVATISAGSSEIGQKIAEALNKVGRDGVVSVEEGKGLTLEIEYKEGMEFDHGYVSPYFVTNPEKMEAEITNPYILVTDKKISALNDFLPFLEKFIKVSKDLVIIADDLEGEALATLVVNKLRGTINLLAVKAPGFGDRRKEMLEDIALLTGGAVISEDTGRKFESIEVSDLGQADKVWSDKDNCRIIGGKGTASAIKGRIAQLKRQIEAEKSDFDKEKLQERLAKLSGGVAQINVGAATEVEMNEKKERVKDAVEATKAAIEEGIIPGGGIALLEAAKTLDPKLLEDVPGEGDQATGVAIVKRALEAPTKKLAENAGASGEVILEGINKEAAGFGYDVLDGQYKDMIKAGIIDPAKVTRTALQNAVSVAIMILTTEALITDLPEKDNPPAGGAGGGMPPGGMGEY